MEDMVQRFGPGEIQAVYAHNDEMALGAIQVLEGAGRLKTFWSLASTARRTLSRRWRPRQARRDVHLPVCRAGRHRVCLQGRERARGARRTSCSPTVAITADNVKDMIGKGF